MNHVDIVMIESYLACQIFFHSSFVVWYKFFFEYNIFYDQKNLFFFLFNIYWCYSSIENINILPFSNINCIFFENYLLSNLIFKYWYFLFVPIHCLYNFEFMYSVLSLFMQMRISFVFSTKNLFIWNR